MGRIYRIHILKTILNRNNQKVGALIGALYLFFILYTSCYSLESDRVIHDLIKFDIEEEWRILLKSAKAIYYFDIKSRLLSPIYAARPFTTHHVGMACFNPRATKIIFNESFDMGPVALASLDLYGPEHEVLLKMPYLDEPKWSPNGEEIAFLGREGNSGPYQIYLYKLKDKTLALLTGKNDSVGGSLGWSPNGKSLVYSDGKQNIVIFDISSKQPRILDRGTYPTWSPDGKYIAYEAAGEGKPGYIIHNLEIKKKELILAREPVSGRLIWSPNSRYLIYSKASFIDYDGKIFVMNLQSKKETQVFSYTESIYPTDWRAAVKHQQVTEK